ncbi:MAG TPA: porin family protein [Bacteroidia bacterium]|nr:porin family protein [Bacteroidia bacterium]HNT79735.1 porin family protein [Bacteroidia bacterium]
MKKVITFFLLLFSLLVIYKQTNAQINAVENLPKYDKQRIHFGFLLGINNTDFKIDRSGDFLKNDSLYVIESVDQSGFNLGIVTDYRLSDHFNLRFIPGLSFAQRKMNYDVYHLGINQGTEERIVESTFLQFPVDLKFKSNRIGNYRLYVLAGVQYNIDMVSQAKVENEEKKFIKLKKNDYGYNIGAGADFYMAMFKFAIELKMYQGLNNLLVKDETAYTRTLDGLKSKIFLVSFTFE